MFTYPNEPSPIIIFDVSLLRVWLFPARYTTTPSSFVPKDFPTDNLAFSSIVTFPSLEYTAIPPSPAPVVALPFNTISFPYIPIDLFPALTVPPFSITLPVTAFSEYIPTLGLVDETESPTVIVPTFNIVWGVNIDPIAFLECIPIDWSPVNVIVPLFIISIEPPLPSCVIPIAFVDELVITPLISFLIAPPTVTIPIEPFPISILPSFVPVPFSTYIPDPVFPIFILPLSFVTVELFP